METTLPTLLSYDSTIYNVNTSNGIVLYGYGELGKLALEYCNKTNIKVNFILDKSAPLKSEDLRHHTTIFNPDQIFSDDYYSLPVAVCIATLSYESIKSLLLDMGWKNIFPFYQLTQDYNPLYPLSNGWLIGDLSQLEQSKINFIFDNLADEHSREHYKAFISWHASYHEYVTPDFPIVPSTRYNIEPLITFLSSKPHSIIDIGAHHAQLFDQLVQNKISINDYHAFEPDPESARVIQSKPAFNQNIIELHQQSIAFQISHHRFHSGLNYCSKLSLW